MELLRGVETLTTRYIQHDDLTFHSLKMSFPQGKFYLNEVSMSVYVKSLCWSEADDLIRDLGILIPYLPKGIQKTELCLNSVSSFATQH